MWNEASNNSFIDDNAASALDALAGVLYPASTVLGFGNPQSGQIRRQKISCRIIFLDRKPFEYSNLRQVASEGNCADTPGALIY